MMLRLFTMAVIVLLLFGNTAYASGGKNHSEFFKDIEEIQLYVVVTTDQVATEFWYLFDKDKVKPPLDRPEISGAVFSAFREMLSDSNIVIRGDETEEERDRIQEEKKYPPKPPGADPFSVDENYVPPKPPLNVKVFVAIDRGTYDDQQFVHGATAIETFHGTIRKKQSGEFSEGFPSVFILPMNKEDATKVIKKSVINAYHNQRRWILCTRVEGIHCIEDKLENIKRYKEVGKRNKKE